LGKRPGAASKENGAAAVARPSHANPAAMARAVPQRAPMVDPVD
jgi:hypothetical protein